MVHEEGLNFLTIRHDPTNDLAIGDEVCSVNSEGDLTERMMADARLIAAAPKLLEALQGFLQYDGHDDFDEQWPAARLAVFEAIGADGEKEPSE